MTITEITIEQAITYAWEDVQAARVAAQRSPNADTVAYQALCEATLNDLLDAWPAYQQ